MKDLKNRLWIAGAFLMLALCAAVNLTGAWFEYSPATVWNLLVSLAYLAFWVAFTVCARNSVVRTRAVRVVASLTLVGGILALIVHSAQVWLLMPPAFLLTLLTGIPLYGLRMFLGWKELYALCALLGGLWLIVLNRMRK